MNIWVDIANAPHVIFFKDYITEWREQGHKVLVTARDLSGSLELLKANDIEFVEIGQHYGASKLKKIQGLFVRCMQLRKYLASKSIDVAVSQSSFYSPLVAKSLGVRCVYTNDNEFAKGNVLANVFADSVIYPESLEPLVAHSFFNKKFSYYPGTKEGIYLSKLTLSRSEKKSNAQHQVCIRPEPWTAQYHQRDDKVLVELLKGLSKSATITILPRDKIQHDFFESLAMAHVKIQQLPLSLSDIYQQFDFFIGAGGYMSRELACMGLPCLSMYQGDLLSVDKSLISIGVMSHHKLPTAMLVNKLLSANQEDISNSVNTLKNQGKVARQIIEHAVLGIKSGA
jgi:hypothetical protein